ncbi:MAG TPA: hypothetical protein VNT26_19395 [Candidatus Sulfotelmatobacter sp.]|nr:hypothetical protein [Candidatus Sulfotelmatobacter sp.]
MNPKLKKVLLLGLALLLLVSSSFVQKSLNRDRLALGLTRVEPLENAPPVLAFTTVALGGFRGLISNALWIRANDLQDEDKFFEMAQLADWITKLEPHFVQVWLVQAWNMAYNISVKFKDFSDRWRWIKRGMELLRDEGLRYNPNEILIYRELGWFFQHKMGQNLDDGNMYFKQQWANEMAEVFAKQTPNLEELIHPQTDDQKARARLLREKYKMDPEFMQQVNERYGPLEWRLPEAHAIYWAAMGLHQAELNPSKIKPEDLIMLRRLIYQSMQMSFQRGRLVANPYVKAFEFGPNLDIIPKVSAAYEQAAREDANNRDHIQKAHRNFLRDAVYFLYSNNRVPDAARWYKYLGAQYPEKWLIDGNTNSYPRNVTLDDYAVGRVQEDIGETSRDRVRAALEGLLINAYTSLAIGEEERAAGFQLLAQKVRANYQKQIFKDRQAAIGMPPLEDIQKIVLQRLLDRDEGFPFEMRAALRAKLSLDPEAAPTPSPTTTTAPATNAAPQKVSAQTQ